ncbi:MAG: hypothetical protein ORN27_09095 [Rhodoluna sp.]|nr:hypothetical protein [Rhodoluna sp.]
MTTNETKSKRSKFLLIGSGAVLVASIGAVFAANTITINSGTIEFGAGVANTTACDAAITTALNQSYSSANSKFELSSIVLSGIADSCNGKTIKVVVVGPAGSCGVDGATTIATPTLTTNAATLTAGDDGFTLGASAITTGQTATITLPVAAGCDSSTVTKIALATS